MNPLNVSCKTRRLQMSTDIPISELVLSDLARQHGSSLSKVDSLKNITSQQQLGELKSVRSLYIVSRPRTERCPCKILAWWTFGCPYRNFWNVKSSGYRLGMAFSYVECNKFYWSILRGNASVHSFRNCFWVYFIVDIALLTWGGFYFRL